VDTALILSISKKNKFTILSAMIVLIMAACSSNPKKLNPEKLLPIKNESINSLAPSIAKDKMFLDMTDEYGLKNLKAVHLYAVKLNNDNFTDLVLLDDFYTSPKFFIFNSEKSKFELMNYPFKEIVRASFLNFADFDHDGIIDLVVGSLNQKTEMTKRPIRLFRGEQHNNEINFIEESEIGTNVTPAANVSLLDFDLDGELDIFIANWFDQSSDTPKIVPNILLKGKGFKFENVSYLLRDEYEISKVTKTYKNASPTFGATICDVDQNGFPDILTNSSNGYFNKMWLNLDKNTEREFQDFGEVTGYASDNEGGKEIKGGNNSFFTACADYNNDGIVDLAVGNLFHDRDPETRDRSCILTGSSLKFPPSFIRSEFYQVESSKNWSEGDRRGVFLDYNLDGLEDLFVENSGFPPDSRLILFEQLEDHAYDEVSNKYGIDLVNPSGVISIDLNHDGILDFIVGQSDVRASNSANRIYAFVNLTKRLNRGSLKINLQARLANSMGISGSAKLITNKRKYFRNVNYNYGSLPSQNESGIYFAFDKEIPQNLIINWPIGTRDRLNRIIPIIKKYDLKKYQLKGKHTELNICEDGRILKATSNCY
jgi:hypothetical protein